MSCLVVVVTSAVRLDRVRRPVRKVRRLATELLHRLLLLRAHQADVYQQVQLPLSVQPPQPPPQQNDRLLSLPFLFLSLSLLFYYYYYDYEAMLLSLLLL